MNNQVKNINTVFKFFVNITSILYSKNNFSYEIFE